MKTRLLHERLRQLLVVLLLALPLALSAKINHGDVNSDNEVNILDVDAVIKVILSGHNDMAADVNNDGEVNILDADKIINIILYGDEDDEFHELCVRASEIDHEVIQYYEQCESLGEMMQYADAIRALDDVEAVYSNGTTTMFVKIKDFYTFMYSFYSEEYEHANNMAQQRIKQIQDVISQNSNWAYGHNGLEDMKFLAVNAQTDRGWSVQSAEDARSIFDGLGFEADVHPSPDVEFFTDGIFDCDYLFIITHGVYDVNTDIHWMQTSVPIERNWRGHIKSDFLERFENYGADEVAFEFNGVRLGEVIISEHLINNKSTRKFRHPGKAVVFNVACQSMMGPSSLPTRENSVDDGLAEAFINRGACAYIGYDESNWFGQVAGLEFWQRLAMGLTIEKSFNNLTSWLYHEPTSIKADLLMYPFVSSSPVCVTQPVVTYEDKSNNNTLKIDLKATGLYTALIRAIQYKYDEWEFVNDHSSLSQMGLSYGYELSENEQFMDAVTVDEKHSGDQGIGATNLYYTCSLTYSPSDPNSKIKPGTTYWVRAYLYDGQGYNYSDPITFTTQSNAASITVPTTEVDFGNVLKGETSTQMLEIQNSSSSPQSVTVKVTSPFSITQNQSSMSSLTFDVPGNSCSSVTLMFTATQEGNFQGTATITSAAIEGGSISVPVHAHVVADDPGDNEVIPVGDTGVSITMVPVEGGTFTMGATPEQGDEYESNEVPAHQVTVSSFSIAQTEVTQALWQAVMGSNPSEFKGNLNRPVENVSWNDCQTFITKLNQMTGRNFRLPTEAEWEFAARGGNKRVGDGFKYSGSNNVNLVAWYWGNIPSQASGTAGYGTQPVATKKANELGLYDMSGNVYEWVQDRYGSYDFDSQTNPTGPSYGSYRVARGGTWGSYDHFCRVSNRNNFGPSTKSPVVGLRLVL